MKDLSTLSNTGEALANCFSDSDVGHSTSWLVWRHDALTNEEFANGYKVTWVVFELSDKVTLTSVSLRGRHWEQLRKTDPSWVIVWVKRFVRTGFKKKPAGVLRTGYGREQTALRQGKVYDTDRQRVPTGLFPCSAQQQPILLLHILLWRSSRFCPWPYTFYHVHHPTKYTNLISIAQPSPVCRRHTAFLLFLSTRSSLQHLQAPDYLTRNLFLDDC